MQCECDCHKTAFTVCTDCCSLRNIREKNKLMSYPNPEYRLFQRVERLENLIKDNQGLIGRIGILGTALNEQSEQLNEIHNVKHLVEHAQNGIEKCFERIEKLESMYQSDFESTKEVIFSLDKHKEAILELKEWKEVAIEKNIQDIERIRKLEKENEMRRDTIGCVDSAYDEACDKIEKRLDNLESNRLGQELDPKVWVFVNERLDRLETKTVLMPDVEETLKQSKWAHDQIDRLDKLFQSHFCKKPHKCPICDGIGFTYHAMVHKVDCKTCEGKGIVWG